MRKASAFGGFRSLGICFLILDFPRNQHRKGFSMRVRIEDTCTACGLCCDTCPEVFEMGDNIAQVIVDGVPDEYEEAVQQAVDECPVEAIVVEPE
jgi:ferredoxin